MLERYVLVLVLLLPLTCWAGPSARVFQTVPHPNVTVAAKKAEIYAWLKSLPTRSSNKIISGQMSWSTSIIDSIQTSYGKKPGLRGFDWYAQDDPQLTTDILSWATAKGAVHLLYHMPNPLHANAPYPDAWDGNWSNLVTNGTTENTDWKVSLDKMATTLASLKAYKVVVLLRPFHEMNGNWFWWGSGNATVSEFVAAWQYMYNYLTITKGLDNIIWVYGPNTGTASSVTARYPGDAYVDMVSIDVYNTTFANEADLATSFPTKPFAVAEYGGCTSGGCSAGGTDISGLPNLLPSRTLFWMNWESGASNYFGLDQPNAGTASIFANPLVITLDEMPEFGVYKPNP